MEEGRGSKFVSTDIIMQKLIWLILKKF
jgi:hypothetical protein